MGTDQTPGIAVCLYRTGIRKDAGGQGGCVLQEVGRKPQCGQRPVSYPHLLYHSITTKVIAIHIQASEAVIQDVFLYHSSITSEIWRF